MQCVKSHSCRSGMDLCPTGVPSGLGNTRSSKALQAFFIPIVTVRDADPFMALPRQSFPPSTLILVEPVDRFNFTLINITQFVHCTNNPAVQVGCPSLHRISQLRCRCDYRPFSPYLSLIGSSRPFRIKCAVVSSPRPRLALLK